MHATAPVHCFEQQRATHNVGSSDVHLVVILFTLGCSRDLSFIFNLKKNAYIAAFTYEKPGR